MWALRDAHAHGATRVSIGDQHLLTGGADGVVSLYSTKHWPKAAALWTFRCHDAAVTDVALVDALELALSCGRDGRILLHESIADSAKLVSRVICQVTGEVRCLYMDIERRRLYIAGDSLRCLDMSQEKFQIRTIPLVVPFPLVSLAVSPCGRYIAMASASGELGVVPTHVTTPVEAGAAPKTQFVFRSVLSPTAKKEDSAMYRMSWCHTATGGLMLMVPTSTEVQVYALEDRHSNSSLSAPRMRAIGGLHDQHFTDLHGALVYPITKTQVACLLATRDGLFVGKVQSKTLAMSRHMSERYNASCFSTPSSGTVMVAAAEGEDRGSTAAVTDVQVNPMTGDVAVGLTDGRISLLRRASPKAWRPATAAGSSTAAMEGDADEDAESIAEQEDKAKAGNRSTRHERRADKSGCGAAQAEKDDDDFVDDGSDDGTASVDSASSASSSVASSDSDAAPEDFGKVVVDLQRDGASLHDHDGERPSRWRDDEEAALAHAKREAERPRGRSRFLDDEAEEGTSSDDEEGGHGDDNMMRARGQARAPYDEEDHCDDDLSMEGNAEVNGDLANGSSSRAGDLALPVGRVPAVQDYSFQVGATPAGEEGNCYLAYNSVGYIHCSRDATTVHFHDISHPAVRLQLRDTILMGALSPVGAAFIVLPADPTEAQGSVDEAPRLSVFYHAFTPLGAQSEWRVALLPGETVRCMAAGIRYVAVATSHYLRIFSLSGLELAVLSKSQRIVTMVGTSSRKLMSSFKADFDPLVIINLTGTGELQMEVIDVGARTSALPPRTVPLTELPDGSTHQLQWLGWSEDGLLHIVDTAGVVRQFTEDWGGSWVPVYDPRTLVDQSYALWVYGISENALLAYRYSRDDPSYPAAAASGLSTELVPLFLPLTRTMGADGLERWDKLLRQQLRCDELKRHSTFYSASIAKYDEVHDHHLLQFFDSALKSQQTTRAMELAMLMEIHDRVVKCAQLANANGHVKLVPKLLALYEMRMATKQKRKCGLPTKEKLASNKKKDELLHKLLGQMLPQDKGTKPADSAAAAPPTPIAAEVEDEESKEKKTENRTSPLRGPASTIASSLTATSPSAVSGVMTADPNTLPSQARRHISFAKEVALAPPPSLSSQSTTTSTLSTTRSSAPAPSRKLANPFSQTSVKPAKATDQVRHSSLSNPQQSHNQHQSQLQVALPTSTPHSSMATATRAATLLGSSQLDTPPRASVAATRTNAVSVVHESDAAKCLFADDATPTGSRVSAARIPSSPGHGASPLPTASTGCSAATPSVSAITCKPDVHRAAASTPSSAFVARELPTTSTTLVASGTPRLSSGAVDPFVEEPAQSFAGTPSFEFLMGSHTSATSAAAEAPISVQSLLDVGHGETAPVVRSDSFGEALRKRYREDEEEDAEEAPLATLPKLSV
ncbi:conserved hypothetical protein [Leishmania major strain Friedlin]|uniref:Uncharacterized protein n=1 Tax=Leishmania major TaxID=5664 RepID=Q4QGG7_LEIMA|nr:conserved hypothetical protein [Leishmania major strain Friedlin]CAG9570522.1 WD_repeat_and_HMG-box_DNA-binding_protein_-_putative [Leishmania major strain Friedlin]CAJ03074.1 conserved hypothetical protein [Leishmania major strain Friedlin]|eukprot:XP_001681731.1 conserved hypothetical protein [Leishmania major strain Friedlin]